MDPVSRSILKIFILQLIHLKHLFKITHTKRYKKTFLKSLELRWHQFLTFEDFTKMVKL